MQSVTEKKIPSARSIPNGVKVIAIVYGIAAVITGLFWILGLFSDRLPNPTDVSTFAEKAAAATTKGFLIADLIFALPLLVLSAIGLWHKKAWGWVITFMVNILWCYSLTVVFIRDIYSTVSPGLILFSPFVPFAIWSSIYLWQKRQVFKIDLKSN
jgi:hypothetical protein